MCEVAERQSLAEWIDENHEEVRKLTQKGVFPYTLLRDYNIYKNYLAQTDQSKMQRYQNTSEHTRCGITVVRDAIRKMKAIL